MHIEKSGINSVIPDNEQHYYHLLEATISSVDEYANVIIAKQPSSLSVRISPSEAKLYPLLLSEVTQFHNLLGIRLILSKSIKNTTNIHFSLTF